MREEVYGIICASHMWQLQVSLCGIRHYQRRHGVSVLVKIAPDLNPLLFQFISALMYGKHVPEWSSISC